MVFRAKRRAAGTIWWSERRARDQEARHVVEEVLFEVGCKYRRGRAAAGSNDHSTKDTLCTRQKDDAEEQKEKTLLTENR